MLVDVEPKPLTEQDPAILFILGDRLGRPTRLRPGVWLWPHLSCEYDVVNELVDHVEAMGNLLYEPGDGTPFEQMLRKGDLRAYGVCDGYEDILSHPEYQFLASDPRPFTIVVHEIRRDEQPQDGGWRWHKWGPYIGTYEPQHEYLYYESIERVFAFRILQHASQGPQE